ncbi:hoxN [Symbiodinium natans]|uniref:Nickel/cobalt efflux system n=1 Tax=Symbiodinium natans TaxID=878477 RepID=A0A812RAG8_9DINO|nr:hoxN [Symbiodinium natans]
MAAGISLTQELLAQGGEKADVAAEGVFKKEALPVVTGIAVLTVVLAGCLLLLAPELLTMGVLAYCLGLRHAVDADHIAAIDNVTRRLTSGRKRPTTVGFFFALGHSTVVVIVCALLALPNHGIREAVRSLESKGGTLSAIFSGGFLVVIAVINFFILLRLGQSWKDTGKSATHDHSATGLCVACCPRLFSGITAPWHMYPVGFIFGLGFETSSEVAVLAMVGLSHSLEHPALVMLLPMMFLVGMCLIDTINGVLMAWVYGAGGADGNRQRLYYNMFVTATSAAIAMVVGMLELLGVLATSEGLHGKFWSVIVELNNDFETVGMVIMLFFLSCAVAASCGFRYVFPDVEAGDAAA